MKKKGEKYLLLATTKFLEWYSGNCVITLISILNHASDTNWNNVSESK